MKDPIVCIIFGITLTPMFGYVCGRFQEAIDILHLILFLLGFAAAVIYGCLCWLLPKLKEANEFSLSVLRVNIELRRQLSERDHLRETLVGETRFKNSDN